MPPPRCAAARDLALSPPCEGGAGGWRAGLGRPGAVDRAGGRGPGPARFTPPAPPSQGGERRNGIGRRRYSRQEEVFITPASHSRIHARPNGLSPISPGISTEKNRPHRSWSPRAPVRRAGDGRAPCRLSWTDCHPPVPTTADSGHAMTQRAILRLILLASATLPIHAVGMAIAGPPDTEPSTTRALPPTGPRPASACRRGSASGSSPPSPTSRTRSPWPGIRAGGSGSPRTTPTPSGPRSSTSGSATAS